MLKALDVIFGPASADSPINNLIQHFIFPFYSETFNLKTTFIFSIILIQVNLVSSSVVSGGTSRWFAITRLFP